MVPNMQLRSLVRVCALATLLFNRSVFAADPVTITFEEQGLPVPNTDHGSAITIKGAVFEGGTLVGTAQNHWYLSNCGVGCLGDAVVMHLPVGAKNVSLDVGGAGDCFIFLGGCLAVVVWDGQDSYPNTPVAKVPGNLDGIFTTVTIPEVKTGLIQIEAQRLFTFRYGGFAQIDNVMYTPPAPGAEYAISAHLTNPLTLPEQKKAPASATVPLGSRFVLGMQRVGSPNQAIVANFTMGNATLASAQSDPTLYPASALLEFNPEPSETTKIFQAVHLGTQAVVITPDDSSIPKQVVTVTVVKPASVGTTHSTVTVGNDSFDLDAKVIEWADKRGIPPYLIKGIIDRETGATFNAFEWRYEPLTTDWDEFSGASRGPDLAAGQNGRALPRYAPYRLEYDDDHPRGTLLVDSEDVHPRHVFYSDSTTKTHFADEEQLVSAYAIVSQNEFWQHWIAILGNVKKKAYVKKDPKTALSWTADTTLASSYGLMQVLFSESFDNYNYPGISGQLRPYYLFDTPTNVTQGAGSLQVGSGVYVSKYRFQNGYDDTGEFSPQYKTPETLDDEYKSGLFGYNGEFCDFITAQHQCYGPDTMNRSKKYLPVPATNVLH